MKFSYKFSNLLGTVYRKGNVVFTPDGCTLLSPVGNKISLFDLKNNKTETLPLETRTDIVRVAISPNSNLMLLVNEEHRAYLCSLANRCVITSIPLHDSVDDAQFSPDGSMLAVTVGNKLRVYECPGATKVYNPFKVIHSWIVTEQDFSSVRWSHDSRMVCATSKDTTIMVAEVKGAKRRDVLSSFSYGLAGGFFLKDSLDLVIVNSIGYAQLYIATASCKRGEDMPEAERGQPVSPGQYKRKKDIRLLYVAEKAVELKIKQEKDDGRKGRQSVTSVDYHAQTGLLLTGLNWGTFHLHEVPSFSHINSFSIGSQPINSVAFNNTGDWLALASSRNGQLVVWEWQSETFILKQQGHFNSMLCVNYSPDGQYIATGGEDHKVKIWTAVTGFCFVTFNEHSGIVTGVTFTNNGKNIVSSSLDGTVRAFDLLRYRNFRTFTSPRETQFSCLAVDPSGELICAGCRDIFDIFVWSMKTGKLLQIMAGHESPVSSLSFSPSSSVLVSTSWDKTLRVWDVFEGKGNREIIPLTADGIALAFRPDGQEVAVTTIRRNILFYDIKGAKQTGSIEARGDLGSVYHRDDKISAKKASTGNSFLCLCYSADGETIIGAGQSPYVCIYSVKDEMLIRRFRITQNLSLDGVSDIFSKKRYLESLKPDIDMSKITAPGLPGVKTGDLSYRKDMPEVQVSSISFSPTGRAWSATTTEGVLVFSLDTSMTFDPYEFSMEVTPEALKDALTKKNYSMAVILSLRINQIELVETTLECVPVDQIPVIVNCLPDRYVDRLLMRLSQLLESTAHVQFYTQWSLQILTMHGPKLKLRSRSLMSDFTSLQKSLTQRHEQLRKICEFNKYTMSYLLSMKRIKERGKLTELPNVLLYQQEEEIQMKENSAKISQQHSSRKSKMANRKTKGNLMDVDVASAEHSEESEDYDIESDDGGMFVSNFGPSNGAMNKNRKFVTTVNDGESEDSDDPDYITKLASKMQS